MARLDYHKSRQDSFVTDSDGNTARNVELGSADKGAGASTSDTLRVILSTDSGGGGGGTQYTEGSTQTTIIGTALLWEDAADVVRVPSATYPLPVDVISTVGGGGGGTTNVIDSNNSTTSTLAGGATYEGTATDVTDYTTAYVQIFSDVDSAALGVQLQTSVDGTNWDHEHEYDYEAGDGGKHYEARLPAQYFRLRYTNGGTIQATFRVQTKLSAEGSLDHAHPLDHDVDLQHPATLVRSVITGETSAGGGGFVNVKVNPSGTLECNVSQDTRTDLLANASLQIEGVDVTATAGVPIKNETGGTIAISATALPLPTGASTATLQTDSNTKLDNILTELQSHATLAETQPVSAATLPLPSGASTATLQTDSNTKLDNILTELQSHATLAETQPVSAATLPLPTGAATSAGQLADNHQVTISNVSLAVTGPLTDTELRASAVDISGEVAAGAAVSGTNPVIMAGKDLSGNAVIPTMIDVSGLGVFGSLIIDSNGSSPRFRAHDETDQGGSTKIGGVAASSEPTAVSAAGDRVDPYFDLQGYQYNRVTGQVAHSDANTSTNDPVPLGGEAIDYASAMPSDVTAAAVSKLYTDLKGLLMTRSFGPKSGAIELTALNDIFDGTTTTASSADIDNTPGYTKATLNFSLSSTNTPTRILFYMDTKHSGGSVYMVQQNDFWSRYGYEDTGVASGVNHSVTFDCPVTDEFRIRVVATGTTGTSPTGDLFEITNAEIWLGR